MCYLYFHVKLRFWLLFPGSCIRLSPGCGRCRRAVQHVLSYSGAVFATIVSQPSQYILRIEQASEGIRHQVWKPNL